MMGLVSSFSGGGNSPSNSAMPYLDQAENTLKQYYDPYIQQGQQAYNTVNPQLTGMASNPTEFLNALMKSYQPSQAYQLKRDEMSRAAGNTAAAGGQRGSQYDINQQVRLDDILMGEDMQKWLQNVLGIQNTGLSGMSNFYNTGYDASKSLSGDLSNILGTKSQLAFQGQRENNQQQNDILGGLLGGFGAGLSAFF